MKITSFTSKIKQKLIDLLNKLQKPKTLQKSSSNTEKKSQPQKKKLENEKKISLIDERLWLYLRTKR